MRSSLFLLLAGRRIASRPSRSLLAVSGLSLAVALMTGVGVLNHSSSLALEGSLSSLLGRATLELSAGRQGLRQSVARKVVRIAGVEAAASVIERAVRVEGAEDALFTIFATDMLDRGARPLYSGLSTAGGEIIEDPLLFLSRPDSLAVAAEFARARRLGLGARLAIMTPRGSKSVVVRAILPPGAAAGLYGGSFGVMDLAAAQHLLGRRGRVDRVDIALEPGVSPEAAVARLQARFPHLTVRHARAQAALLRRASASVASVIALAGLFTLAAGCFLVFNLATLEAEERQGEIALLHCLGAPRRALLGLLATQGAVVGAAAGGAGAVAGAAGARLAAHSFAAKVATIASLPLVGPTVSFYWPAAAAAVLAAVVASTVGFSLAALPATGASALAAARGLAGAGGPSAGGRHRAILGAFVIAASLVFLALEYEFYLGFLEPLCDALVLVASALLFPSFLAGAAAAARSVGWQRMPVEALLAIRNTEGASARAGSAVGVLGLTVAVVLVFATIQRSIGRSIGSWVEGAFAYDLEIASESTDPGRVVALDEELASKLKAVEGVRRVHLVRWVTADYRGAPITVHSLDYPLSGPGIQRLLVRQGDAGAVYRQVASGRAVAVSENFASRFRVGPGDVIAIGTPRGPARLEIAGVAVNYNSEEGTIMMSRSLFTRLFEDRLVNYFLVALEDRATLFATRRAIARRFGARYHLVILTLQEAKAKIDAIIGGIFRWIYALEALVAGIGLLTVLNTMSVCVLRRRPQLALLRAAGAEAAQVGRAVRTEALFIGLLGVVLGGSMGAGLSLAWVVVHLSRLLGWVVEYSFPGAVAGATFALTLAVAASAGLAPAWLASRLVASGELRDPGGARL